MKNNICRTSIEDVDIKQRFKEPIENIEEIDNVVRPFFSVKEKC
jgi:hypothetical protein